MSKESWKLTEQQRREVVAAYLAGEPPLAIERRYGLSTGGAYSLAVRRHGPAARVIAGINRLEFPEDLRAVMAAAEKRLRAMQMSEAA